MLNHEMIRKTEEFLKDKFAHATEFEQPDIAYRIEHTYRVANIGREIAQQEGFDETEMVIACLLHDISYCEATGEGRFWPTVREHGRRSAQIARPFLEELGLPKDRIEDICYGIAIHVDGRRISPARRPRSRFPSGTPTASTARMFIGFMKQWPATNSWKSLLRRSWSILKSGLPACPNGGKNRPVQRQPPGCGTQ